MVTKNRNNCCNNKKKKKKTSRREMTYNQIYSERQKKLYNT